MYSLKDYNYHLPENKIAKYPLPNRDQSKLLIYNKGAIAESIFSEIHRFLPSDSLLCFNDTRVIKARIIFQKTSGSYIEVFLLEPINPSDYYQMFQQPSHCRWNCMVGNLKKWKNEELLLSIKVEGIETTFKARIVERSAQWQVIDFSWTPEFIPFGTILEAIGKIPIPPYLNRESEEVDNVRYQTIFSKYDGSVAAPTAGLHFTESVLQSIRQKNIQLASITLHVGAGTFRPIKNENVLSHEMHAEHFYISKPTLEKIKRYYGNITAVGTTTLRALESMYWIGVKLLTNGPNTNFDLSQWENKNLPEIEPLEVIDYLLEYFNQKQISIIEAETSLMIVPDYSFKVVNRLITNFHQPQSTLLLLVAAFVGTNNWQKIYDYALTHDFRFLSYGDSSLLIP